MPPRNPTAAEMLGRIDERTENFGRELGELKKCVRELADKHDARISSLEDDRTAATGGRRVWGLIGNTVAGTIGAALMAFINRLS
jgi:hypothetical protein